MAQNATLSAEDIQRLMEDHSADAQMEVVGKLTSQYGAGGKESMTQGQTVIAEDIFKLLLSKAEVQVRSLIATNLRHSDKLPPTLAKQMAADVKEVSLPIIESCTVLTDEDLLEIIRTADDTEKLLAVARRDTVSETVSDALVETKVEKVVSTLVENEGAKISEKTFDKIVENHADSHVVMESMIQRGTVPSAVVDKLIERISGPIRQALETKYGNLVELKELNKMVNQSLEMTSLKMMGLKASDEMMQRFVKYLGDGAKLSPYSAICMGNYQVFEVSMSRLMRVPLKNVQQLLRDKTGAGIRAAYTKSGLPESMYESTVIALAAFHYLDEETGGGNGVPIFSPMQVMQKMKELQGTRPVENIDYLYAMMQHHMREQIRYQTKASGGDSGF